MASHHPSQNLGFGADSGGLAAADADISEDPYVDAAGQDDGQAQQQEADERMGAHTEHHDEGGVDGVVAGFLGWRRKQGRREGKKEKLVTKRGFKKGCRFASGSET